MLSFLRRGTHQLGCWSAFSSAIGISIAAQSIASESSMSEKEHSGQYVAQESFNGIAKMKPTQADFERIQRRS